MFTSWAKINILQNKWKEVCAAAKFTTKYRCKTWQNAPSAGIPNDAGQAGQTINNKIQYKTILRLMIQYLKTVLQSHSRTFHWFS